MTLTLRVVEDVAGEIAQALVVAERVEHGGIALRDRHGVGVALERHRRRDAAAELDHERVRRLLDQIGVDHRQEAEVGGLVGRQVADDAARALAVDVEAEVGVGRHGRQVERRVVGEARARSAGTSWSRPPGSRTARRARRRARCRGTCARRTRPCSRRRRGWARPRPAAARWTATHAAAVAASQAIGRRRSTARHHSTLPASHRTSGTTRRFSGATKYIAAQEQQPAQARAGQVGEIDAPEDPLRLEEDRAQIEGAGQERQHVEQEVAEQPPLLRRVGDEEDGVEGDLLRGEVRRHRQRAEQQQRGHRHPLPVPLEPALARRT